MLKYLHKPLRVQAYQLHIITKCNPTLNSSIIEIREMSSSTNLNMYLKNFQRGEQNHDSLGETTLKLV